MVATKHKRAVGVFPNYKEAEQAFRELKDSGFPMEKVSVIVRDADQHDNLAEAGIKEENIGNKADEGAATGAVTGGVLGGLTGLLVGLGTLAIPGVGPILLAGEVATALATTAAGTAIGAAAGGLLGALIGLGIPEERARVYDERVSQGDYLVIITSTEEEIRRAERILGRRGIQEWGIYDVPDVEGERVNNPTSAARSIQATPDSTETTDTALGHHKYAVGVFPGRQEAELAVTELNRSGLPTNQIFIVAQEADRINHLAGIEMRSRVDNYASWGIPPERSQLYASRLERGNYLVAVKGSDRELRQAETILTSRGGQEFGTYDPSQVNVSTAERKTITNDRQGVVSDGPDVIIVDKRS